MSRRLLLALSGLLAASTPAFALDPTDTFAKANQAYTAGEYGRARESYEALVRQGDYGANVFYNLGNTAWRMGDGGAAALNFQRALILQTSHPEAVDNLKLVREKSGAKVFPASRWDVFFPRLIANAWMIAGTISCWIFLFALVGFLLRNARVASGIVGALALGVALYCSGGWMLAERRLDRAVVIARTAEARYAPLDNSPLVDTLPTASEVRILQNGGAWAYCLLPTNTRAWIPSFALAPLRPPGS